MKSGMAIVRLTQSAVRRLSTLGIAESIALAVAVVAVVAYVTTSTVAEVQTGRGWLLDISSHRVAPGGWGDIVKVTATILGIFAATIAAVLATRRQHTAETQQRHDIAKSRDERASALYVAAATQLGSDKAPLRIAGMYSLDRLGCDHPEMRQTVVDLWCAYLRTPSTERYFGFSCHGCR